jgi:hypothetical protein
LSAIKQADKWTSRFDAFLEGLQLVVRLEGWLGHVGRVMQASLHLLGVGFRAQGLLVLLRLESIKPFWALYMVCNRRPPSWFLLISRPARSVATNLYRNMLIVLPTCRLS